MSDPTLSVALWVGGLAASACAGGIGLLLTTVRAQGKALADNTLETTRIRVALTGIDGQNGVASEVRALKKRVHDLADEMQPLLIEAELRRRTPSRPAA